MTEDECEMRVKIRKEKEKQDKEYKEKLTKIKNNDPQIYMLDQKLPDFQNSGDIYRTEALRFSLDDNDAKELVKAAKNNQFLKIIDVGNNGLSDKGAQLLATLPLDRLGLDGVNISKETIIALANNPTLTKLELDYYTNFDEDCVSAFITNKRIVYLNSGPDGTLIFKQSTSLDKRQLMDQLKKHIEDNKKRSCALLQAAVQGNDMEIRSVLKMKGYLESRDDTGNTPLISASWNERESTVDLLIQEGADVNARNYHKDKKILLGDTPLHAAAKKGNINIVNLLLSKGADKNILNLNGKTPAQVAHEFKHNDVAKFIDEIKQRNLQSSTANVLGNSMAHGIFNLSKSLSDISLDEYTDQCSSETLILPSSLKENLIELLNSVGPNSEAWDEIENIIRQKRIETLKDFQVDTLDLEQRKEAAELRKGLKNEIRLSSLLPSQISDNLFLGIATDNGDCFFDSLAQTLNTINNTDVNTVKYLRMLCHDFYLNNEELVNEWNVRDYGGIDKQKDEYYMVQYTSEECKQHFNGKSPMWGRPYIEGRILCHQLSLEEILVIEILENPETRQPVLSYHVVTRNKYKNINEEVAQQHLNNSNIPTLVVEQNSLHFVPLLIKSRLENRNEQQIELEEIAKMGSSYTFGRQ